MDESQDNAVNTEVVEDNNLAPSASEETTTPVQEDQAEGQQTEEQENQEQERQKPRPAQRRIQSLVEENKSLKEQLGTLPTAPPTPQQTPKLSELLSGRESVDPSELDKMQDDLVAQAANGLVDLKVQALEQKLVQQQAVSDLEKDAVLLSKEYPELDEKNDKYNPRLEEAIAENWKRQAVRQNPYNPALQVIDPKVSLAGIAKELVELTRSAAQTYAATTNEAVATQADNAAMTPGTETAKEKSFTDMSESEMQAVLKAKGYDV